MIFNFRLCLIVLLFTMFGAVFCVRSSEGLRNKLSMANLRSPSASSLAGLLGDVAEYCKSKEKSQESDHLEFTVERLKNGELYNDEAIEIAQHCLSICSLDSSWFQSQK
ncbi:uncharacterized protein LOC141850362 [Brevipalpus obovatus]|uniref:uncharacterized protein LOC141850362 n=1 Tax=Brevipalpus obovatus TaxID=246614 RepID=UPI003D9E1D11